jgi:lipoprotein signal peptidase
MEQNEIGKYTRSFGLSFTITSILSALLVILKETNEDTILAWMKAATGHHWVTHGVLDIILFLVLGWLFSRLNNSQGIKITPNVLVNCIFGSIVISGLLIAGFFV